MPDFTYTKLEGISPIPIVSIYLQNPTNPLLATIFDCGILDTSSDITIID